MKDNNYIKQGGRVFRVGDWVKLDNSQKDVITRYGWSRELKFNKPYRIIDLYGGNIIFKNDAGWEVNGHGINPSRVIKVRR